jgi:hypothetical protein
VKPAARIALLTILLASLPLRGYAGVLTALCEAHHGGTANAQEHVHELGDSHHDDSVDGDGPSAHTASVCSVCASCCAGASLAPDMQCPAVFEAQGSYRIDYFDCRTSGFVPENLDRPPLAL